jgi:hypothetical protein
MGGKFSFPNSARFERNDVSRDAFRNSHTIAIDAFFGATSVPIPTIAIQGTPVSRISDETGKTTCSVTFRSDVACDQWEARAGGTGQGSGLLVGSGSSVGANADTSFDVTYDELTGGDQTYRINVYGHNATGWTAYVA